MPAHGRQRQCAVAVRTGVVDVGAGVEQEARGVDVSVPRGEQERREAPRRRSRLPRPGLVVLRSPVPRNCTPRDGAGVDRCAVRQQHPRDLRPAGGRRPHIRAVCPFSGSVASTTASCSIRDRTAAGSPVAVQRMRTVSPTSSPRFASAPAASRRSTTSVLRLAHATHNGVAPSALARVHVRAGLGQPVDRAEIVPVRRPVQRRRAVALRGVGVDAAVQEKCRPRPSPGPSPRRRSAGRCCRWPEPPTRCHSIPTAASWTHCCLIVTSIRHDSPVRILDPTVFVGQRHKSIVMRSIPWQTSSIAASS